MSRSLAIRFSPRLARPTTLSKRVERLVFVAVLGKEQLEELIHIGRDLRLGPILLARLKDGKSSAGRLVDVQQVCSLVPSTVRGGERVVLIETFREFRIVGEWKRF